MTLSVPPCLGVWVLLPLTQHHGQHERNDFVSMSNFSYFPVRRSLDVSSGLAVGWAQLSQLSLCVKPRQAVVPMLGKLSLSLPNPQLECLTRISLLILFFVSDCCCFTLSGSLRSETKWCFKAVFNCGQNVQVNILFQSSESEVDPSQISVILTLLVVHVLLVSVLTPNGGAVFPPIWRLSLHNPLLSTPTFLIVSLWPAWKKA